MRFPSSACGRMGTRRLHHADAASRSRLRCCRCRYRGDRRHRSSAPDGKTVEDTFRPLHEEGVLLMADCATIEDIRRAVDMGFDLVSTTLSHGVAAIDCTMPMAPTCRSCVRRLRNSPAFLSFARVACIRPRRLAPRSMLAPGPLSSAPPSRTPRVLRVGSRLHLRRKTSLASARGGILNIGN